MKVYTLNHAGGEYEDSFDYVITASLDKEVIQALLNGANELREVDIEACDEFLTNLYKEAFPLDWGCVMIGDKDDGLYIKEIVLI